MFAGDNIFKPIKNPLSQRSANSFHQFGTGAVKGLASSRMASEQKTASFNIFTQRANDSAVFSSGSHMQNIIDSVNNSPSLDESKAQIKHIAEEKKIPNDAIDKKEMSIVNPTKNLLKSPINFFARNRENPQGNPYGNPQGNPYGNSKGNF